MKTGYAQATFKKDAGNTEFVQRMFDFVWALYKANAPIFNAETGQSGTVCGVFIEDGCVWIRRNYGK